MKLTDESVFRLDSPGPSTEPGTVSVEILGKYLFKECMLLSIDARHLDTQELQDGGVLTFHLSVGCHTLTQAVEMICNNRDTAACA